MYLLTLHQYNMEYFRQTCTGKFANKVYLQSCIAYNLYFATLNFSLNNCKKTLKTRTLIE